VRLFLFEPRPARLLCFQADRGGCAAGTEDFVTFEEGYLKTAEGYRLYFVSCGSGANANNPPVVVPNGIYLREDFEHLARQRRIVFYDVRNRGQSETLTDAAIERGIQHDVDDLDAVKRGLGVDRIDVLAHSYIATMPILYAMKYPAHVNRIIQIGPLSPYSGQEYPADLKCEDETYRDVLARLGQLEYERSTTDPVAFCRKFWDVLKPLYVVDPADAGKIRWERCNVPNERNGMKYFVQSILPSIKALAFTPAALKAVNHPVLVVHGRKDRSAAYGGGRDWASSLGNARLVTVDNAAHAPWIEAPDHVFGAIETFLAGEWPSASTVVASSLG
jgi:pimeloyl-ACP methyl ester carboxylesterase